MKQLSHLLILLWFAPFVSQSAGQEFSPARFGTAGRTLIEQVPIPDDFKAGALTVRCASLVRRSGRFGPFTTCEGISGHETENEEALARSVIRVVSRIKIQPASVGGRRKEVWFTFAVALQRVQQGIIVRVFHNDLSDIETLGEAYTSPQRYDMPRWGSAACRAATRTGHPTVVAEIHVSPAGKAGSVVIEGLKLNDVCEERIRKAIERSRFIPGTKDGSPVEASYIERFFTVN